MKRRFGGTSVIALAGLAAATCGDSRTARRSRPAVSDSAGVPFVRNGAVDDSLSVREVLRIGVVDGDPDFIFDRIYSMAADSAGGFWVSDSYEAVRHYGSDGGYLGSVGSQGAGPGESQRGYGSVWVGHGTVFVLSYEPMLQLFDGDGELVGSRSPRLGPGANAFPLGPHGNRWLYYAYRIPTVAAEHYRVDWVVGEGPATEPGLDTLFVVPGQHYVQQGPGHWSSGSFFDGAPSIEGDAEGRVYYAHPLDYRIDVFGPSGALRRAISRDVPGTPYPADLRDEVEAGVRRAWAAMSGGRVDERSVARMTDGALPVGEPKHLPFLEDLFVSRDGYVWALRGDRHPRPAMRAVAATFGYVRSAWFEEWRAPLHLDLFGPDGAYRGSVVLPARFVPMAVTRDRVIGSIRDDLDVERIVIYAIEGHEEGR